MIALALLFIFIIALLGLIVRLLHKYFVAFNNLNTAENKIVELQGRLSLKKNEAEALRTEKEINDILNERLWQMEQRFEKINREEDTEEEKTISDNLKILLNSYLNLLKTDVPHNYKN